MHTLNGTCFQLDEVAAKSHHRVSIHTLKSDNTAADHTYGSSCIRSVVGEGASVVALVDNGRRLMTAASS